MIKMMQCVREAMPVAVENYLSRMCVCRVRGDRALSIAEHQWVHSIGSDRQPCVDAEKWMMVSRTHNIV